MTFKDLASPLTPQEFFVEYALTIGALEIIPRGRELKSGRVSPYFFNSGLFNTGESLSQLAKAYVAASTWLPKFDVIYGPAYKGIPLAISVAQAFGDKVGYCFNRKEEKNHGEGGVLVGHALSSQNVLIVDDVMTTGTSSGEAVKTIIAKGGTPMGCVIAFDREERGADSDFSAVQQFEQNYSIPVRAAARLIDLINLLARTLPGSGDDKSLSRALHAITEYKSRYGV